MEQPQRPAIRLLSPLQLVSAAAVSLIVLSACGGGGSSGSTPTTATFQRIQTEVFDVSCSSDSCHSSVGQAGGLVLDAGSSWDALMEQPPTNPYAADHGFMRVMRGNSERSFLFAKLTNNLAAGEGLPMPYNAAPLDAGTQARRLRRSAIRSTTRRDSAPEKPRKRRAWAIAPSTTAGTTSFFATAAGAS